MEVSFRPLRWRHIALELIPDSKQRPQEEPWIILDYPAQRHIHVWLHQAVSSRERMDGHAARFQDARCFREREFMILHVFQGRSGEDEIERTIFKRNLVERCVDLELRDISRLSGEREPEILLIFIGRASWGGTLHGGA